MIYCFVFFLGMALFKSGYLLGKKRAWVYALVAVVIENITHCEFTLQNKSGYTLSEHSDLVTIKAGEKQTINVKTVKQVPTIDLKFEALNAINAPNRHPVITLKVKIP